MKWLYLLFRPCRHKWEIYEFSRVFEDAKAVRPIAVKAVLQCSKCGDIKVKHL
jgi:hypothetical protein